MFLMKIGLNNCFETRKRNQNTEVRLSVKQKCH